MARRKILVLGIDGGTLPLIEEWIDEGELPTFSKVIKGGASGLLESSLPYTTFPAWKCYSTGRNPGKLGVYWFLEFDRDMRDIKVNSSLSFKSDEYWDILGYRGFKVGIINMPTTYPPKRVNGFMISGFGASNSSYYTYPKSLKYEIEEKFDYKVNPYKWITSHGRDALNEYERLIKSRFEVLKHYHKYMDLLHLTIYLTDNIQHFYWSDRDTLLRFYKLLDYEIGEILDMFDIVFIMSDHGFTDLRNVFFINRWFEERGLITLRDGGGGLLRRMNLSYERLNALRVRYRFIDRVIRILPEELLARIKRKLPGETFDSIFDYFSKGINWEETSTIPLEGLIYLLKRDEKLRGRISRALEELVDPLSGRRLCEKVYGREEIYSGPYVGKAPDLVISPSEGFEVKLTTEIDSIWGVDDEWRGPSLRRTGVHTRFGMFIAYGRGIRRGIRIPISSIYDLAPTILSIYGVPIAGDMDGRPLEEIFLR